MRRGCAGDTSAVHGRVLGGAVRIARETGRPIAQVARALGINAGTRGNWVAGDHSGRGDLLQSAGSSSPDRRPRAGARGARAVRRGPP